VSIAYQNYILTVSKFTVSKILLKIDEYVIIEWSTDMRHTFHLTYKYKLNKRNYTQYPSNNMP